MIRSGWTPLPALNECTGYLEQVLPVEDESAIPSDSLLREFIGGSSLKY